MRTDVVIPSPQGHHRQYVNAVPRTGLVSTRCPERMPQARSTSSRTSGGAFPMLPGTNSVGKATFAAMRAAASISSANDEVTH